MRGSLEKIAALATALIVVAACGAPATPQASPSASPSVAALSPSPVPTVDVAAAFGRKLVAGLHGSGTISGAVSIGTLEFPVSGSIAIAGQDSQSTLVIQVPGQPQASSNLSVAGKRYTSSQDGPWFEDSSPVNTSFASAFINAAATVADVGVETKLGRPLHHLVPKGGSSLTGEQLGMTDEAMRDATGDLEFYAQEDGTLVVLSMALAWTQTSAGAELPAKMQIDFSFDSAAAPTIAPPDDVWKRHTSDRYHYSIGYPTVWRVLSDTGAAADAIGASPTEFSFVLLEVQPKPLTDDLQAYVNAWTKATRKSDTKLKFDIDESIMVGGRPAHRFAYHDRIQGNAVYSVFTLVIRGRDGYQIGLVGPKGQEAAVVSLHDIQLATFKYLGS
jgi:hypothetical protein